MIDVYEMLRMKENDIVRVQREIQALRFVAPMLLDAEDVQVLQPGYDIGTVSLSDDAIENPPHDGALPEPEEISQAIPPKRSRLLNLLGLAAGE